MSKKIAPAALPGVLLFLVASAPVGAAPKPHLSWGKIGVSFEQYRLDAVECGRAGYYLDLAETEQARVFKRASSELDANEAGIQNLSPPMQMNLAIQSAGIVEGTRPAARFRELRAVQEGPMTACLRDRGYTQFKLTQAQEDTLKRLRRGSPERHQYLHRLASDPAVLEGQKAAQPWVVIEAAEAGQGENAQR